MEPIVRLKNSNLLWTDKLRPRVGTTVISDGFYYSNVTGYNGSLSDPNIWFQVGSQSGTTTPVINKTASDITGSDPFWQISLAALVLPNPPSNFGVWVDQLGDGNFQKLDPVQYNSNTKIITGLSSPTDFPAQIIKIFIS